MIYHNNIYNTLIHIHPNLIQSLANHTPTKAYSLAFSG